MIGVAFKQSDEWEPQSFRYVILSKCLRRIFRTGGIKPATCR